MGRSAIASADVVRLPLPDGDYITVKTELNAGEALDLDEAPGSRTLGTVIAFLVGWSLVGDTDQPIPYSPAMPLEERRDTVRALRASTFNAITDVLLPHIQASRRRIEEKKNSPGTRARIMTNLAIARLTGMTYHDVRDLPLAVYEVLLEDLQARHQAQQEALV